MVIVGQILAFVAHFVPRLAKKQFEQGAQVVFPLQTLLLSSVKAWIFCPKTTKFGPELAFLVILGQTFPANLVPCWWVGWWLWRAGCTSQDTYLLYGNFHFWHNKGNFSCKAPFYDLWDSNLKASKEKDLWTQCRLAAEVETADKTFGRVARRRSPLEL